MLLMVLEGLQNVTNWAWIWQGKDKGHKCGVTLELIVLGTKKTPPMPDLAVSHALTIFGSDGTSSAMQVERVERSLARQRKS